MLDDAGPGRNRLRQCAWIRDRGAENQWEFVRVFMGGALLGDVGGYLAAEISHRLKLDVAAVVAATLVLAYGSFILAEHGLHLSGVMATTTAALTFHGFGMSRLPRQHQGCSRLRCLRY